MCALSRIETARDLGPRVIPDDDGAESAERWNSRRSKWLTGSGLAADGASSHLETALRLRAELPRLASEGLADWLDPAPLAPLHVVEFVVAGGAEVIIAHNMRDLVRASGISRLRWSWPRALIAED